MVNEGLSSQLDRERERCGIVNRATKQNKIVLQNIPYFSRELNFADLAAIYAKIHYPQLDSSVRMLTQIIMYVASFLHIDAFPHVDVMPFMGMTKASHI